jgi:glycosyltransferase involved in cell wall biosynthesis
MRLLLISHEYPPIGAGGATAVQALARELKRAGHDVEVLTSAWATRRGESDEEGVRVHHISALRRSPDRSNILEMASFLVLGLVRIPSFVRQIRPDGMIAFFSIPAGPLALLAWRCCEVPYVVALRGGDVPGNEPRLRVWHAMLRPLRRAILRNSAAVTANSTGLKEISERTDAVGVKVIPNGVDAERFAPSVDGPVANDAIRLLFVGRLQEQKNIAFLLQQFAALPAGQFELRIVGDGPLKPALQNLTRDLGLTKSVNFVGWMDRDSLPHVYRAADCLVNPSLYEGMPNSVLEAMACGLPVIASRVSGNSEAVLEGVTGVLFDLHEPAQLRDAIMRMSDSQIRRSMGEAGRRRVLECFNWPAVAAQYVRLFE